MLYGYQVRSENTRLITEQPSLQLDNLITAPGRPPIAVEAEYEAVGTAEADAAKRLGLPVVGETNLITAAIALRYPDTVRFATNLKDAICENNLSYAILYEDQTRFPAQGWMSGSVSDLAELIRLASIPQKAVDNAATALEQGIENAASVLNQIATIRPRITATVAHLLGMTDVPQTRRMVGAIIANAMVFHQHIAGMHSDVKPLHLVCGPSASDPQQETLKAWAKILKINYWTIFAIAKDILEQLPTGEATMILQKLRKTVQDIDAIGVTNTNDLTGQIFQRLIADRKYLATFYTLPASATLLARLAVSKITDIDWSNAEDIGQLRIADFACGTGALLSAVYEQIASRHEQVGGNPTTLHKPMMEDVLYGCDVMPSAIHITGSTLSGMQPNMGFGQSRLYTLAYGRQPDTSIAIGSLELLQSSSAMTLFNTSNPAMRTGSAGEQTAAQIIADIPDKGFDLVIMNPPFTRATNHEGSHANITNPAFAAFNSNREDQTAMGNRINKLGKDSCYHGNAGISSAFAALADKKLKPGGVLALVLPLSVAAGLSWQSFRQMLANNYTDLEVLSIAANSKEMSFSSDTSMAECLVIARKTITGNRTPPRFTSLHNRPTGLAQAAEIARNMKNTTTVRNIEDGPYGGTHVNIGSEKVGEITSAKIA